MTVQQVTFMIMAQDMKRAITFYKNTVGLKLGYESPEWSELKFGDAVVALHGGWKGGVNKTGLSFQVSNINEACEKAEKFGGTIVDPAAEREGEPIFLAMIRDTEGNEFMFCQRKTA